MSEFFLCVLSNRDLNSPGGALLHSCVIVELVGVPLQTIASVRRRARMTLTILATILFISRFVRVHCHTLTTDGRTQTDRQLTTARGDARVAGDHVCII